MRRLVLIWPNSTIAEYTRINLEEAYPDFSDDEVEQMLRQTTDHLSQYFMESFFAWGAPEKVSAYCSGIEGLEPVLEAQKQGHPVLLLTPHHGCTELASIAITDALQGLGPARPIMLYRTLRPVGLYSQLSAVRFGVHADARPVQFSTTRALLELLRKGGAVGMAIDSPPSKAETVRSSFLGVAVDTSNFQNRLVRLSGARVFAYTGLRTEEGFRVHVHEVSQDIASEDERVAARAFNKAMEDLFALAPEQGHWYARRFAADLQVKARYNAMRNKGKRTPRVPRATVPDKWGERKGLAPSGAAAKGKRSARGVNDKILKSDR